MLAKTDRERDRDYLLQTVEGLRRGLARYNRLRAVVQDVALNQYDATLIQVAEEAVAASEALERRQRQLHEAISQIVIFITSGLVAAQSVEVLRQAISQFDGSQEREKGASM
jgi:hypothetical protein